MKKRWLKFYPKDVNPDVVIEEKSLNDLLDNAVSRFGNDISLEYNEEKWSYLEVQKISNKLAGVLYQRGFKKGDRLSIMLPNCPHYIFSAFAVFRLGGIVVQTNPMYVERELEYQLNDANAEFMICHASVYERVKRVQSKTSLKKIIIVQVSKTENGCLEEGDHYFDDFLATYHADAPLITINPVEDLAVLQYTGGTTGVSKGVMLTHQNFITQIEQFYEYLLKRFDISNLQNRSVISFLPFFHIFGFVNVTLTGFRFGYKQIIIPRFETKTVLELIQKQPPFLFFGVPTMFTAMLHFPKVESYGIEKITGFFCGSSPLPQEIYDKFKKLMGAGTYISDGYGLSEATSGTLSNPYTRTKLGSVGIPIPKTEVMIGIEQDTGIVEAPVGMRGEILVRGPQVMKGYWNNSEETAAALKEGWLHTGDIGYMDEEGYFYVVDRKKDMIIASGYNVYPREIEDVIYQIPDVREVVVIGIPDEYRGETVKAYISLKKEQMLTEADIIQFCRENLAAYKVPKMIEFRDELPKSAVGKLLKRELRDQELAKMQGRVIT
ncbi:long-chain-fatty-acid--CoA ligase [Neobacillus bataviensis LMG 21833]|uniref:Long-chain-fatty-acid--CoA ligase n=1 Tax=Neobacillus bataviensis LMG 21833 TaxID=1117379 RepID=K6DRJ2_9BACI|nr:long-chain fatty acid--CoA ligase [Neobacillus bataviensis]EKN70954.1 long-chain-fatty-acid--CoA ligase [Neobacillus bataviensis LMG 21833]